MYQMLVRGQWRIADTCPQLIAAIPIRVHDPKKPGDLLKVSGDPLDDVMDSARYGLYSWVTSCEKPPELRMHDQLRQLAEQKDLTSAAIRYAQYAAESEYRYQSATLGRLPRRR